MHSCAVGTLSCNKAMSTVSTVASAKGGGIVNLFSIQFVLNFIGNDQKWYSIERGSVTRWHIVTKFDCNSF